MNMKLLCVGLGMLSATLYAQRSKIISRGNTDYYAADRTPYAATGGQCGYMSPLATPADRVQCRDAQEGFKHAQFPLWACD